MMINDAILSADYFIRLAISKYMSIKVDISFSKKLAAIFKI